VTLKTQKILVLIWYSSSTYYVIVILHS